MSRSSAVAESALNNFHLVALIAALVVLPGIVHDATGSAHASSPPGSIPDRVGPGVAEALAEGPALIVVALEAPDLSAAEPWVRADTIRELQDSVLDRIPPAALVHVHRFRHVPAVTLLLDGAIHLETLAEHPDVRRIDLDVGGTGALAQTVPLTGADDRHALGNTGSGVTVAVLDSGVDSDHPDLAGDVIASSQACFGWNNSPPGFGFCPDGSDSQTGSGSAEDDAGHGTHVSGIVTSDGVVSSPGFAPDAELVALKIMDNCSFAGCFYSFTLNVVAALDHIIANPQDGVDVINMSVGTGALFAGDCDDATSWTMAGAAAIDTLHVNGVVAFASAGNNSLGAEMSAPACLGKVVSVGASDDLDAVAGFSNSNSQTDIFAPGVSVTSDAIGGGTIGASGTSMASPSAAGCAALLLASGEATTPHEIESRLETSPVSVTDPTNGLSFPRIDCNPSSCASEVDLAGMMIGGSNDYTATERVVAGPGTIFDGTSVVTLTGKVIELLDDVAIEGDLEAANAPIVCP